MNTFIRAESSQRNGRARRLHAGILVFIACLLSRGVFGQTNAPLPLSSNRWLLVVETSSSMERRAASAQQIAAWLVASGMRGEMQRGDTVGVWTYNDDLQSGKFPLQMWTPETTKEVAGRVFAFLRAQKFEKQGRLDAVMPGLDRLIKDSPFITVILISDGQGKVSGTPFDDKINTTYQTWQKTQQKADMPFVTMLRGGRGKISDYVVNTPPFPFDIPPLPPEAIVKAEPANTAPKPPKVKPPMAAPLIIHGKKPEPQAEENPSAEASTNAAVSPAAPAAEQTAKTDEIPSGPAVVRTQAADPDDSKRRGNELTQVPQASQSATPSITTEAPDAAPTKSETAQAPIAAAKPVTTTEPASMIVAARSPEPSPAATAEQQTNAAVASSSGKAPPTGEAQTAVTLPPQGLLEHKAFWIAGLVVLGAAFGIILLLIRRARRPVHISLITQSLDRENK